jgi:hypothetical protein
MVCRWWNWIFWYAMKSRYSDINFRLGLTWLAYGGPWHPGTTGAGWLDPRGAEVYGDMRIATYFRLPSSVCLNFVEFERSSLDHGCEER